MLRILAVLMIWTTSAVAFHDNTFAVFELREQLQMLYLNMWELLHQLEYVTQSQRVIVYCEIDDIRQQDQIQHP